MRALVHVAHDADNVGASIASGSFQCAGMVIAPCSMRTLAAVAHGLADSLLTRAADVMLKERRRLVLLARETPLHLGHLRNMVSVTEMGAIVCPRCPRSTCTRAAWTTSWTTPSRARWICWAWPMGWGGGGRGWGQIPVPWHQARIELGQPISWGGTTFSLNLVS